MFIFLDFGLHLLAGLAVMDGLISANRVASILGDGLRLQPEIMAAFAIAL